MFNLFYYGQSAMAKIDLADSKEWYETAEQARAYLDLVNSGYGGGMAGAEEELLAKNKEIICTACADRISYIDLGPGNGNKTILLCDALHDVKKLKSYAAVDIQSEFLTIADKTQERYGVPSLKLNSSFEEFLSKEQPFKETPKFIYLGATFGNFNKDSIEPRLIEFMKPQDVVYLSAARLPENTERLVASYSAILPMLTPLICKKGLKDGVFKVVFNQENSAVESLYETKDTSYLLAFSRKYSIEAFKAQISPYFEGEYIISDNHIGFIGRKKK